MTWAGLAVAGFTGAAVVSVVAWTVITGMSPMPASARARREILRLVAELKGADQGKRIIDCGSGWGNLVISLARRFPDCRIVGYELSPLPWFAAVTAKRLLRLDNLELYRENFLAADLSGAHILTCYLSPRAMEMLQAKIDNENLPIEAVISNTFALPSRPPDGVVRLRDWYATSVYLYRFRPRSSSFIDPLDGPRETGEP